MLSSRASLLLTPLAAALTLGALACGASAPRSGYDDTPGQTKDETSTPAPGGDFDKNKPAPPAVNPSEVNEVFGHSSKTLFRLDPKTKAVTAVGDFSGCDSVIDIALDEASTIYAASYDSLYRVDKNTAKCSEISSGSYPNSLSFVPKGTALPNDEALVGYDGSDYVRIDTTTGSKTKIGTLGGGFVSSGDIVSVKGGKTYLTVKGGSCNNNDCLVEVDPATGALVKNWGSIEHKAVFGLSFWAGKIYGFSEGGDLFEVTFGTSQLATSVIPIPSKPAGLSFWGAGSSTSAPLVDTTK